MSQNPFAAPESYSSAVDTNSAGGLVLATQGQRFIHFIIDGIIARILSFAAGMLVALAYIASTGNVNLAPQDELKLNLIALPFGLLAVVFYYIFMEAVFQRTLGKLITGTIVVTIDGGQPSFGQVVGRSFAGCRPAFVWVDEVIKTSIAEIVENGLSWERCGGWATGFQLRSEDYGRSNRATAGKIGGAVEGGRRSLCQTPED